jgi:hypothetical protein
MVGSEDLKGDTILVTEIYQMRAEAFIQKQEDWKNY